MIAKRGRYPLTGSMSWYFMNFYEQTKAEALRLFVKFNQIFRKSGRHEKGI
jgi:hypothetical protein